FTTPGRRPGTGHRWPPTRVGAARRREVLAGRRRPGPAPAVFSLPPAARDGGGSATTSTRLVASGGRQRAPGAPGALKRADVASEGMRQAWAPRHGAGNLPGVGNDAATPPTLLTYKAEVDQARYDAWGWWGRCWPQGWSTAQPPIAAPRCGGAPAMSWSV